MTNILEATTADAQELEQLVNSAYRGDSSRRGWTTEADLLDGTRTDAAVLQQLIQEKDTTILKYVEQEKIKACIELKTTPEGLYLGMLTVQPDLQGKGVGKILLAAAEDYARKSNLKKIFMTVISVRDELIAWYVRHGYRDTGKRKPFNISDPRFGQPKQKLEFTVLEKDI